MGILTIGVMTQSMIELSVTWRLCLLMWYCAVRYHPITYKEVALKDKNKKDNELGDGLWHHNEDKAIVPIARLLELCTGTTGQNNEYPITKKDKMLSVSRIVHCN